MEKMSFDFFLSSVIKEKIITELDNSEIRLL